LTGVNQGGTLVATYVYNALDQRIGVKDSGTQTWTVYDGQSPDANPYADFNSSAFTVRYLFGPGVVNGAVVSQILARTSSGGTTAWYLTDKLGSVRDIISTTGTSLDHIVYDSFGNIVTETNASNGDRFKFAGMQFDATIGQHFDHARWYGSGQGRFLAQDPLAFSARDTNLYRFVSNSATNAVDTSGMEALTPNPTQILVGLVGTALATGVGMAALQASAVVQLAGGGTVALPVMAFGVGLSETAAASVTVAAGMVGIAALEVGVAIAAIYAQYLACEAVYWVHQWGLAVLAGGVLDAQIQEARTRIFLAAEVRHMLELDAVGVYMASLVELFYKELRRSTALQERAANLRPPPIGSDPAYVAKWLALSAKMLELALKHGDDAQRIFEQFSQRN
jgi:RHS repeat-associated protein